MSNLNSLSLIGRLGRDPVTRTLPSGMNVTNVSLAVSEKWKDKAGQPQERTTWFDLAFWDQLGGIAQQYLRKGSLIYVEGPVSARAYAPKDGGDPKVAIEVRVNKLQMLSAKGEGGGASADQPAASGAASASAAAGGPADFDDEVPF